MLISVDSRTYILSQLNKYKYRYPFLHNFLGNNTKLLSENSGPQKFLSDLVFSIEKNNLAEITFNFLLSDLHLINAGLYSPIWKYLKPKKREKVILRLDGIGIDSEDKNTKLIKKEISNLINKSNLLIYQSKFCESCFQDIYDYLPNGIIIKNGASKLSPMNLFTKNLIDKINLKFKGNYFALAGRFTERKRIREVIEQFNNSEIGNLVVLSDVPKQLKYSNHRILYLGMLEPNMARHIIANSIALIHFDRYDWCPNLVVSAIQDKIPVICSNFGGTPEITGNNGIIIDEFPKDLPNSLEGIDFVKKANFPINLFKDTILNIYNNGLKIDFDKSYKIEKVAREYINSLKILIP